MAANADGLLQLAICNRVVIDIQWRTKDEPCQDHDAWCPRHHSAENEGLKIGHDRAPSRITQKI